MICHETFFYHAYRSELRDMLLGSKDLVGSACVSHEKRGSKNDFKQSLSILIYSNFFH